MQGIGQLLTSCLLLVSLLSVLAQNEDAKPSQLSKRSADDLDQSSAPCGNNAAATTAAEDSNAEEKRFNEFVGKRADADDKRYEFVGKRGSPYEFVGKRPYEFLGKRSPYEFLGKRSPYEFLGKRSPYEFLGKRSPYEFLGKRNPYEFVGKRPYEFLGKRSPYEFLGKRSPYEFLGKRSPYEFLGKRNPYEFVGKRPSSKRALIDFYGKRVQLPYEFVGKRIFGSAWERLSANTVENDALVKDVSDVFEAARDASPSSSTSPASSKAATSSTVDGDQKVKRYSEWLGKRGQVTDKLLRDLVNKRISAMVRQRLQAGSNSPEFIGRREGEEEDEEEREGFDAQGGRFDMKKRYTEFVGK